MIESVIQLVLETIVQVIFLEMSQSVGRGRARSLPKEAAIPGTKAVPSGAEARVGKRINAAKPSQNLIPDSLVRNLEASQAISAGSSVLAGPPKPVAAAAAGYPAGYDEDEDDWDEEEEFESHVHPTPLPVQGGLPSTTGNISTFQPAGYEDDEDDWIDNRAPSGGAGTGAAACGASGTMAVMCPAGYEDDDYDSDFDFSPTSSSASASKNSGQCNKRLSDPDLNPEFLKSLSSQKPQLSTVKFNSDPVNAQWLEKIEREWQDKRPTLNREIGQILRDCYHAVDNPYITALYLMSKAKDFYLGKNSGLYNVVIREFEHWIRNNEHRVEHLLDDDLKIFAFQVSAKKHTICLDPVIKAFRLDESDTTIYIPFIRYLLAKTMYKECATCITKLKLQDHFTIDEVVLPLILQDKINLVESYVYRNAKQQEQLVMLLDELCDDKNDISELIQKNNHVPDIRRDKLQPKMISKLAIRLLKLYDIPADRCPNINKNRQVKALRYLLFRKFNEKSLNQENWDELVLGSVGDDRDLKLALIDGLVDYYEMEEGARWAVHFDLPPEELPRQIVDFLESEDHDGNFQPVVGSENWDAEDWGDSGATRSDDSVYYQLSLPREEIYIVSNKEEFYQSLGYLKKEGNIIGLDAEWRPDMGLTASERVALLQAADAGRAYLYDTISLASELEDSDWQQWGTQILATDSILKLGFGFQSDFKVLSRSIPGLCQPLKDTRRFVDLLELKNAMLRACPDVFDTNDNLKGSFGSMIVNKREEVGLSNLVKQCLGKPLDKSQQMSNWEFRPLRQAQIIYAALDAFVLPEVYKVLKDKIKQHDLQVSLEPCTPRAPAKLSRQEKKQKRVAEKPEYSGGAAEHLPEVNVTPLGPPIKPKELSVVTDTMLQGLGRHLRCCGVDTVILENNQDHDECGKIAKRDNRVILTSGQPYLYLKSQVPEGRCINVAAGKARDQVVHILKLFNVTVEKEDIFSRCQICNGTMFSRVPSSIILGAIERLKELQRSNQTPFGFGRLNIGDGDNQNLNSAQHAIPKEHYEAIYQQYGINLSHLSVGPQCVLLELDKIPTNCFSTVKRFTVCLNCGKIFWKGVRLVKPYEEVMELYFPGQTLRV